MYKIVKRFMDLLFSALLVLILFPIFLILYLLILLLSGRPVFFRQLRIGKDNSVFLMIKFRTMREKNEKYKTDEQRITSIGRVLRLFRLDELPQLFNIFLGNMSFIGPRPLLPKYLPYYTKEEISRHDVRPGLSGYSQIKSLNYPKWEEQFEYDIYYVKNISFKLDFFILLKTIEKIVRSSSMVNTGIAEGRPNFDVYREQQVKQNPQLKSLLNGIENTKRTI